MAIWESNDIVLDSGETVKAQAPVIISASRATDIPAFFADWFRNRFKIGYIKWINPFNGKPLYVNFDNTRLIVFWSKNPEPMIKHLDYFDSIGVNYYFQYSLNDYEIEGLEAGVPSKKKRIETFKRLSNRLGKSRVIWRYDPLLITKNLSMDALLERIERIGDELYKYTNKLVFSFADISAYKKVQNNLKNVPYIEFDSQKMEYMAKHISQMARRWGIEVATCSEKIDLDKFNIKHNKCVDDDLMIEQFYHDQKLMKFLGVEVNKGLFGIEIKKTKENKDKGQREDCGCIVAKDIGQYNTCVHKCIYCYANTSAQTAMSNYKKYLINPNSESIIGV